MVTPPSIYFTVTSSVVANGAISFTGNQNISSGATVSFTITPSSGFATVTPIGGTCPQGTLNGTNYTTGVITANCTVTPSFSLIEIPIYLLTVNIAGTGSGSLNTYPAGISISGNSKEGSAPFTFGENVTITQAPAFSTFTGWSGDCSGTAGCAVTMNGPRSVTANYIADPSYVKIEGENPAGLYYTIESALAASGGRTVKALNSDFTETEVIMNSAFTILLKGGYTTDSFDPASRTGYTTIDGSLKIRNGTLRVERVKIR